jgi:hypothetical protein
MPNWYHHLRRLIARVAGPPQLAPGSRRRRIRPKVEALEERRVPGGLPPLSFHLTLPPGTEFKANTVLVLTENEAPGPAFQRYRNDLSGTNVLRGTLEVNGQDIPVKLKEHGHKIKVVVEQDLTFPQGGELIGTIFPPGHRHHGHHGIGGIGGIGGGIDFGGLGGFGVGGLGGFNGFA